MSRSMRPGGVGESEASDPRPRRRLQALAEDPALAKRFERLRDISRRVRSSEYHLTNACNIRCEGCWFFAYDFDQKTREPSDLETWRRFARKEAERGVTAALLIGGEPTLHPDRIAVFTEAMDYVTISSNGLKEFPSEGFENVAIALTLFGGVGLDDRMRAIKPNGSRFSGLFERTLLNYKDDPRATFIYAIDPSATDAIEETVRRIGDNGNLVSFNYYSEHGSDEAIRRDGEERLLDEALRVADRYPETVLSHPYYIRALITGRTEWGEFGYESCPSISVDHPAHAERLRNGNPVLPGFNAYTADTEEVAFCCTSGHCETCRDSQAVHSWLVTNVRRFMRMEGGLALWIELAESYWKQFVWSELHRSRAT
ncbi:MAG TPA: radical SAM protein [Myxococcota bacterium]|nr:radical SAM protein [Myxococcota bacterium]